MSKVMLVEDDNNLREIYEARLMAEGYDIVSAHDGEEALVVAKNEQPDLIISDVMMPKISGFEMLDILRNTDGLKDVKVIMLTALGQSDDQQRADRLGADRYLVKSQVTLEDIVKVAQTLLDGDSAAPVPNEAAPAAEPVPEPVAAPEPVPAAPVAPVAEPPIVAAPVPAAPTPAPVPAPEPVAVTPAPTAIPEPAAVPAPDPTPAPAPDPTPVAAQPVAAPAVTPPASDPPTLSELEAQTLAAEQNQVASQISSFEAAPAETPAAVEPSDTPEATPAVPVTDAQSNDALMANAVQDLMGPSAEEASAGTQQVVAPTQAAASAPAEEAPVQPQPAPSHDKRVIAPLDAPADKPDLAQLLAIEEAKEIAAAAVPAPQAGQIAAPQTPPAVPPTVQPLPVEPPKPTVDPNSIAL